MSTFFIPHHIVTGGTRGIGFSIVKRYLENGANVAIAGSRQESVEKAMENLGEYQGRVMGIWPNLGSPEEVAEAFASVKEKFGSLDILANNAGISSRTSLYDYTLEEFQKIVDINLTAVFICSQAAARIMKNQGGGIWTAFRMRLSGNEICGKWSDKITGERTGKGSYPCERSGSGCDKDRHGSRTSKGNGRKNFCRNPSGTNGRASGYCQRLSPSGK